MIEAVSVYMTASSAAEANNLAETLVGEGLAACVNVMPGIRSVYRWQGKIEQAEEVALIAKTRRELAERLIARAKALHSYDCPCIVVWPIVAGLPAYLDWIAAETTPAA